MLNEISGNNMTDLEKAYLWTEVADAKGQPNNWTGRFENPEYNISITGSRRDVRDSQPTREWNTGNHAILGFTDGYHASLGRQSGDNGVAEREIRGHESVFGINLNPGDTNASLAMVSAYRGFRADGFKGFAEAWRNGFLASP